MKEDGNQLFRAEKYVEALQKYTEAISKYQTIK